MIRSPRVLSDERLATMAGTGSDPAFAMLYRRYDGPLHGYCLSIVRNAEDARDVLQSAWMKALVALRAQSRKAPVRPWLFRIVHNEAIDLLRRRRGDEPLVDADRLGGTTGGAADEVVERESMAEVVADLRALPDGQRAALVMREWADLGYEEIAVALATSEGNARQLVFSARSGLVESRAGRNESCDAIRLELAGADGRRLRNRRIRSHLDTCDACREFSVETRGRRRAAAAALLPWGPGGTEMLGGLLGAGGTAATGLAGGSAFAGGLAKTAAVAAFVTGGVGAADVALEKEPVRQRASVVEVATAAPRTASSVPSDAHKSEAPTRRAAVTDRRAAVTEPASGAVIVEEPAGAEAADREAPTQAEPVRERRRYDEPRTREASRQPDRRSDPDGAGATAPRRDGGFGSAERDGRRQRASTHTDFLRPADGSHMSD